VLRRIVGPRRDEVTGGWRKLHNVDLHDLCSSPGIIRIIKSTRKKLGEASGANGEKRNACKLLRGKPE
jgi:hypothetical protein